MGVEVLYCVVEVKEMVIYKDLDLSTEYYSVYLEMGTTSFEQGFNFKTHAEALEFYANACKDGVVYQGRTRAEERFNKDFSDMYIRADAIKGCIIRRNTTWQMTCLDVYYVYERR